MKPCLVELEYGTFEHTPWKEVCSCSECAPCGCDNCMENRWMIVTPLTARIAGLDKMLVSLDR